MAVAIQDTALPFNPLAVSVARLLQGVVFPAAGVSSMHAVQPVENQLPWSCLAPVLASGWHVDWGGAHQHAAVSGPLPLAIHLGGFILVPCFLQVSSSLPHSWR